MKRLIVCAGAIAALACTLAITACAPARDLAFGEVDTQDQRAYRAVAIYAGLASLAEDDGLTNLDAQAFEALETVVSEKGGSPEAFTSSIETFANRLRLYAAGAGLDIPLSSDLKVTALTVAMQAPGVASEVIHVRRLVKAVTDVGRDPTPNEWAALLAQAQDVHSRIQGHG